MTSYFAGYDVGGLYYRPVLIAVVPCLQED